MIELNKGVSMKKILLLFYICFGFILPVCAANWEQIGDKLYIDTDSIEHYSEKYSSEDTKRFSFWIKSLNDGSSYFTKMEKTYGKKVWYTLSRDIVDCNEKTIANKSVVVYDLKSQVIDSYEAILYSGSWNSIVPDSIGELYYYNICRPKSLKNIIK